MKTKTQKYARWLLKFVVEIASHVVALLVMKLLCELYRILLHLMS